MNHWTTGFYAAVDSGDPRVSSYFASEIRCQVGNHPPTVGLDAMFAGGLGQIVAVIQGSAHEFINVWNVAADMAVLESWVTYHRRDGRDVKVPAITVVHRNHAGLIDNLRLYIDTAPLFDGITPATVT